MTISFDTHRQLSIDLGADIATEIVTALNNSGVPGPQGPAGPQGDVGPQGPQGPAPVITQTSRYYVDGSVGDDLTADGSIAKPFKTIQACLNLIGQPVSMQDYLRHIVIYLGDSLSAGVGNSGGADQSWDGVYEENLTVPSRPITMIGFGVKIGKNHYSTGDSTKGNILKEYSKARSFGVSSSDLRPCLTLMGIMNSRDTHNRLRNGFSVSGTNRTAILTRAASSIVGNGTNKITVTVAPGQFHYPITILTPAQIAAGEPYIRIKVGGCATAAYNTTYDITAQISSTTFEATRVSGTNPATTDESGYFFECDSAGSGALTHDSAFVNTYQQGLVVADSGTAISIPATNIVVGEHYTIATVGTTDFTLIGAPANTVGRSFIATGVGSGTGTVNRVWFSSGTEVMYANNSRFYTGIQGAGIYLQRLDNNTFANASITAGSFIPGMRYIITSLGTTDFTLVGAANNNLGTLFTASGVGSGTGTAQCITSVNTIAGVKDSSFSGAIYTNTFTYGSDDWGWMNNRINPPGATVAAGSFVVGYTYVIAAIGTTDFTLIGASANVVGTSFVATGVGTGTGTAYPRYNLFGVTVNNAGQTIRVDSTTLKSFTSTYSYWGTNTPTIDLIDGTECASGTDTSGVPGDAIVHKPNGIVGYPALATSVTITNNLVTSNSWVTASVVGGTTTPIPLAVTVTNGSFTIYGGASAPAMKIAWCIKTLV